MPRRAPIFRPFGWKPAARWQRPGDGFYKTDFWKRLSKACKERDGYRCVMPNCETPDRGFGDRVIADHIVPRDEGGADALGNLRTLCPTCDNRRHLRAKKAEA